jgi:hypothetical protein
MRAGRPSRPVPNLGRQHAAGSDACGAVAGEGRLSGLPRGFRRRAGPLRFQLECRPGLLEPVQLAPELFDLLAFGSMAGLLLDPQPTQLGLKLPLLDQDAFNGLLQGEEPSRWLRPILPRPNEPGPPGRDFHPVGRRNHVLRGLEHRILIA